MLNKNSIKNKKNVITLKVSLFKVIIILSFNKKYVAVHINPLDEIKNIIHTKTLLSLLKYNLF